MHAALQWEYYSHAVDDNELPGGPGLLNSLSHLDPTLEAIMDSFYILNILMADFVFVSMYSIS
jgi:hypothetical protein